MCRRKVSRREIPLKAGAKDLSTRLFRAVIRKPNCCLFSGCRAATLPPPRFQHAESTPPPEPAPRRPGFRHQCTARRPGLDAPRAQHKWKESKKRGRGRGRRDGRRRWAMSPHHQGSKTAMAQEESS